MKRISLAMMAAVALFALRIEARNILTQKFDNQRTGANLIETTLKPSNVAVTNFGRIFERAVDGQIYCQPLIVENLSIGGKTRNVIFIITAKNVAYAFDAEDPAASSPLWVRNFGGYFLGSELQQGSWQDIQPYIGTHGTPVIDLAAQTMYFVTKQKDPDGTYHLRLRALNILDGTDRANSGRDLVGTYQGSTFDHMRQAQRPGLTLQGGRLYIGSASHADTGDYKGWILVYDPVTLDPIAAWNAAPTGWGAGIWMSGGGFVGDGSRIYFTTGNGDFNANTGGNNYGESFVGMDANLNVLTWFTPANFSTLNQSDQDLGSAGVMMIPGTRLLVSGGKDGKLYLVNADNMGGWTRRTDACLQSFSMGASHLHGGPAFWSSPAGDLVYVWPESGRCTAYRLQNGLLNTTPFWQSAYQLPSGMPGGMVSVSANGTADGIVWATHHVGDANHQPKPGILRAFNAATGAELYNSTQHPDDDFGLFAKNPVPIPNNGRVYVPTFSDKLVVYGIIPNRPLPPPPPPNGTYRILARHSGKAMHAASSTSTAHNVEQRSYAGTDDQKWVIQNLDGDKTYKITSVAYSKVLDVSGQSTSDGGNVIIYTDNGGNNQKFMIEATSDGYYRVRAVHSGKAVEVANSSTSEGANVQQWTYNGGLNQQWLFESVSGSPPVAPSNLTATAPNQPKRINLSWTQSTSPNIAQNKIYRSTTSGGPYSLIATISATTSYADSGLTSGTAYYYVVTAVNSSGLESGYSNQGSATAR